jgi:phosphocarrier protein
MKDATLDIINKLGLHARAAAKLRALCASFDCTIAFGKVTDDKPQAHADGKSIMALMLLAAGLGTRLYVRCEGSDEEKAVAAIAQLFANRFDESE